MISFRYRVLPRRLDKTLAVIARQSKVFSFISRSGQEGVLAEGAKTCDSLIGAFLATRRAKPSTAYELRRDFFSLGQE